MLITKESITRAIKKTLDNKYINQLLKNVKNPYYKKIQITRYTNYYLNLKKIILFLKNIRVNNFKFLRNL